MKCIVYVSFSLFVLIDTPHYAIFAFQFHVGSFLFVEWNHVDISILDCKELLQIFDELTNYIAPGSCGNLSCGFQIFTCLFIGKKSTVPPHSVVCLFTNKL